MKKLILLAVTLLLASTSYAYYQAEQGRWMSRDPIEEKGGPNIYSFVGNDLLGQVDLLGLCSASDLSELPATQKKTMCCALQAQLSDPDNRERSGELYKESRTGDLIHRPKDGSRVGPPAEYDENGEFEVARSGREELIHGRGGVDMRERISRTHIILTLMLSPMPMSLLARQIKKQVDLRRKVVLLRSF